MNSNKIISGELFQSLAQICLYDEMTDLIRNQNNSLPQNLVKMSDLKAEDITSYKIIYVYTQFLDAFFNKFFNFLSNDTILISHNSDLGIHNNYIKYLNSDKIKKWYCQNRETYHPKLFSLPIGLANSQWPHGNQDLITSIREENNSKEILVYKNFDISTNYGERQICNSITNNSGIPLSNKTSMEEYWRFLSKSVFVISPPGNGIDCHRIWESLLLRCSPIVLSNESFSEFKDLPILFVNSWEEVTLDFLKSNVYKYSAMFNNDITQLIIEYWDKKINNYN